MMQGGDDGRGLESSRSTDPVAVCIDPKVVSTYVSTYVSSSWWMGACFRLLTLCLARKRAAQCKEKYARKRGVRDGKICNGDM